MQHLLHRRRTPRSVSLLMASTTTNPSYTGYQGAEGGLLGAVSRVQQRKHHKRLEQQQRQWFDQHGRKRPGFDELGQPDGTIGTSEVTRRLAALNNGGLDLETCIRTLQLVPIMTLYL